MANESIKALIFDFDGLILDTERSAFQTWADIYEEHGCQLSLPTWASHIGTDVHQDSHPYDPLADLEVQYGRPVDRASVTERRRLRRTKMLTEEAVRPGLQEYLAVAQHLGLKLGVASSSPHDWVDNHLHRLGIFEQFDCIKCAEDATRAKPFPDLYQVVLDTFGIAATWAIAFEDSPNGILAAQRAGIFCVAVPNTITAQLPLDHADLILPSLAEMPLEDLLFSMSIRPRNDT